MMINIYDDGDDDNDDDDDESDDAGKGLHSPQGKG